jgi:hypothetical protein
MTKKTGSGAGEFFQVDLNTIYRLVRCEAKFNDICSYLILSRGSKPQGAARATAYGANAISHRLNISRPKAEKHLRWLESANVGESDFPFIRSYPDKPDDLRPKNYRGVSSFRWIVYESTNPELIYLPNSLCDGLTDSDADSPIARLGKLSDSFDQNKDRQQVDALLILLRCYLHYDLDAFGGLDPRTVFYELEESTDTLGQSQTEIPGTRLVSHEIQVGLSSAFNDFISECLPEVNEHKVERFWQGFDTLLDKGLLYRATTVWRGNPTKSHGRSAEILYTLYVHDFHARKVNPYLQKEIHTLLLRNYLLLPENEFFHEDERNIVDSGRFRFLSQSAEDVAVGIFRLRFHARTRDTGIGIQAEHQRKAEWSSALHKLS